MLGLNVFGEPGAIKSAISTFGHVLWPAIKRYIEGGNHRDVIFISWLFTIGFTFVYVEMKAKGRGKRANNIKREMFRDEKTDGTCRNNCRNILDCQLRRKRSNERRKGREMWADRAGGQKWRRWGRRRKIGETKRNSGGGKGGSESRFPLAIETTTEPERERRKEGRRGGDSGSAQDGATRWSCCRR